MKKLLSLILAAVMLVSAVLLTSCSAKTRNLDDIKKAGEIILYTEAGFAPYEFLSDNKVVGVDIAIMQAVADKIDVKLSVKDVAFDTICASVKSGKADVGAAGITINEDRKKTVDFSIPYSSTEQFVIVPVDNTEVTSVENLAGKKIGVQQGTTSDILVDELVKDGTLAGSELVPYKDPATAVASIPNKVDAVVTDKLTAQIAVNNSNGKVKAFKLTKADGSDVAEVEEYGIAVAKGNDEFLAVINEVLEELLADGTIDKWTQEYTDLANSLSGADTEADTAEADTTEAAE